MHPKQELQEIMDDLTNGPPTIFVCLVNYQDGSSRAYTFSIEENLEVFIENLEETAEYHDIVSYTFFESLLDVQYDCDYTHYTTWH